MQAITTHDLSCIEVGRGAVLPDVSFARNLSIWESALDLLLAIVCKVRFSSRSMSELGHLFSSRAYPSRPVRDTSFGNPVIHKDFLSPVV